MFLFKFIIDCFLKKLLTATYQNSFLKIQVVILFGSFFETACISVQVTSSILSTPFLFFITFECYSNYATQS
jgi:hypothetical protein